MSARELPPPKAGSELLAYLLAALAPMNRTRVKQLLRSGRVLVNGASVTRHDHPLKPGDTVTIARDAPAASTGGLAIVYEDAALVVIDKPAGLLTVATETEKADTAFVRLREQLAARRAGRPFVVHRLDRDTSGLLLFAKSPEVRDALQSSWDAVTKTYLAVVEGTPNPPEGVVENYLTEGRDLRVRASKRPARLGVPRTPEPVGDAKRAVTRYKLLSTRGRYSLVEVTLETGRKHQIRVHMAGLGCPVAGDSVYGAASDPAGRLALHAWKLGFDHPVTGGRVELEAAFPERLRRVVAGG